MITAKAFKSGNSLVITLPTQVVNYLCVSRGDCIRYTIKPDLRVEITRLEDEVKGKSPKEET